MSETQLFTRDEVLKNNGKESKDVWIIIGEDVYDVTEYMVDHPGGSELIEEFAGKDATSAFSDAGHSSDARKQLKKLKIGAILKEPHKEKEINKTGQDDKSTPTKNRNFLDIISCGLCGRKD